MSPRNAERLAEDLQRLSLQGKVRHADSDGCQTFQRSFFSAQVAAIQPIGVLQPECIDDVQRAVRRLSKDRPQDHNIKVGIKSGGHTPFAVANVQDGIVIDMAAFSQVHVSGDGKSAVIGAGARWGDVYKELEGHGLAVSGGRASHIGVGGLTLGGGLSFFSPLNGFVCDNVIGFEVVLASGDIVHATKDSHHDLWLALKGGSNNFGVVTSFTMKTFPLSRMWGGNIYYPPDERDRHIAALARFACAGSAYDANATVFQSHGFMAGMGRAVHNAVEYAEPVANPPCLRPFTEIPSFRNTTRLAKLSDLVDEIARNAPAGRQQFQLTTTVVCEETFLRWCIDQYDASIDSIKAVPGVVWSLVSQPLPPVITKKSADAGGNSLGLAGNDKNLLLFQLVTSWSNAEDEQTIVTTGKRLMGQIDEEASRRGLAHRFKYLNYAWHDQDPLAGYGAESLAHLRTVSKKYDPTGFFQDAVSGGFKLF